MTAPRRRRLVVATSNRGKLEEIRAILGELGAQICSLEGLPAVEFPEEGSDYAGNALGKARAVAEQLGELAVADDSGLEVDALGGAPGPFSARYGGPDLDDAGRVEHLLQELTGTPAERRKARFVCFAALALPGGEGLTARGECPGRILTARRGLAGFGYDPVFQPEHCEQSMAELPVGEKNRLSHRGRAFRALRGDLIPRLGSDLRR